MTCNKALHYSVNGSEATIHIANVNTLSITTTRYRKTIVICCIDANYTWLTHTVGPPIGYQLAALIYIMVYT